jgi:hypothetical protein
MSDGNRTFVLLIPTSKLSGTGAVNALLSLTAMVYQNTLPATATPQSTSQSAAQSATPSGSPTA